MPDPRMTHAYEEIATRRETYRVDGTSLVFDRTLAYGTNHRDKPVKVTANGTVGLAGLDEAVHGALQHIEPDGSAVVATAGFVRFSGAGTVNQGIIGNTGNVVKAGVTATSIGRTVHVGSGYVIVELP
jgi:hypothetical protein